MSMTTPEPILAQVPLSLGIETVGGGVNRLIRRGAPLPARATEIFTTVVAGEAAITLQLVQGERARAADCAPVAAFSLRVRPQAAGQTRIGLELRIDATGQLRATATDLRTGEIASVSTRPWADLDGEAVAAFVAEAERHADEDERIRRLIELRNEAAAVLLGTEAALTGLPAGDVAGEERRHLNQALDQVQSLMAAEDPDALAQALSRLNDTAAPILARLQ